MSFLAGNMKITVEHLGGADFPYERAGVPASWGNGLTHEDIGEARAPVTSISYDGMPTWQRLLLAGAAVACVGFAWQHLEKRPRSNPRRRRRRSRR